jgi:hypothetical protein
MTSLTLLNENTFDSLFTTELFVDIIESNDDNKITVNSLLELKDGLIVDGNTTFNTISINNLNVSGNATFNNNLSTSSLSVENDTFLNNLIVSSNATFNNNLSTSGLIVENDTFLNNLIVSGNATFNNNLSTSGLSVENDTFLNNLIVSGNATFNNIFSTNIESTNATFINLHSNNLDANNATFNNLFSSNIDANNIESNKATFNELYSNSLIINSNATFNNNLSTSGFIVENDTFLNNLIVSGNATFNNNLSTSGLIVENDTFLNNLIVSSNATFNNNVSINTLSITNLSLNGNLFVSGSVGIGVSATTKLDILGRTRIRSLGASDPDAVLEFIPNNGTTNFLFVNNSNELVSTSNVRCPRIFQSGEANIGINGNHFLEVFGGNNTVVLDLHSLSASAQDYDVRLRSIQGLSGIAGRGNFSIEAQDIEFRTPFDGGNRTIINQSGFFGVNCLPSRTLEVSGNIFGRGDLLVSGNATFNSNVSIGTITTTNLSLNGSLIVSGNSTFGNGVSVSGLTVVHDLTCVVIKVTQNGSIFCQGNATFGSNIGVSTLVVSGNSRLLTASITGQLTLQSNCIVGTNITLFASTGKMEFGNSVVHLTRSNNSLLFITDNSNRMVISQNGFIGINTNTPTSTLHVVGRQKIKNLSPGDTSSVIEMEPQSGAARFFFVDTNVGRFNLTSSIVSSYSDTATDGINLENTNTTSNLTRGSHVRFSARDTVNTLKAIGGIVSLPVDVDYINSITRITGRKANVADFNSVEIRHANQSMIIGLNTNAGSEASLFLVNDTTTGARGARFHYAGDGNCYFDLGPAAGSPSTGMYFRIDNSVANTTRAQITIEGDVIASRRIQSLSVPALGTTDAFVSAGGILSTAFSDIRMKKDIEHEYDIDDIWKTIKPIKYFYKTDIANQTSIKGGYRKTYGLDATSLHESIKNITPNTAIQMCIFCQNQAINKENCKDDCCSCNKFEKINACNYTQREIISICISKINELETNLVKERIQYKLTKDKQDKLISNLSTTLNTLISKLKLQGLRTN